MNSFIENVNYLANLDNKYGSRVEIYKNNLSLRTELHDIVFTLEYYNFSDKKLHTLEYLYSDISIDNFNSTLLNLKSQVELTGLFDCVVSFSYTNFVINNVANIDIKITSNSDNIKTYGFNLNITKDLTEIYNINGIVSDTLKILPVVASLDSSFIDAVTTIQENIDVIKNAEANAIIASEKAVEALSSSNIAIENATISINNASVAILSANNSEISAELALTSATAATQQADIATVKSTEASASASSALISKNESATNSSNSLVNANNASISEANALAYKNSALSSKNSSAVSETNALSYSNLAHASELSSQSSATSAASSAINASNSEVASASSATLSSAKATESFNSANDALTSKNKAEKWATELEDVQVEPGKYSAMHWALKAEELASGSADNISYRNTISGLTATDVQAAIDEIVIDTAGTHDAANITTGTLSDARLPASISSDITGNAATSSKWATSRTITLSGDVTGSVGIDGSDNVTITTSVSANSVTLGTDTTGNYVAGVMQGTGISVSGTIGEGWSPTVTLTNVGEAGTYRSVTTDAQGRVTSGTNPATVSGYGLTDVYTKTQNDTSLALKVNNSEKGVANGVSTLDANGKVVLTQIPDSVLGQLEYMGVHNFTSMPTATQKGQYWIASTSGNGYVVGDWAVWNGSAFDKVDNTDAVATVAGRTGNVVLTNSDVGLANVDNTADSAKPVSTAQQTALNLKANLDSPTFTGTVTAPTFSGELSGNATSATTATKLNASGGYGIQSLSSGISYSNAVCMREAPSGFGNSNDIYAPRLGFNWGGMAASSIALRSDGGFKFVNNPGTAYENVYANIFYGSLFGNADTATKLQTAITINGVSFDGSANITVSDTTKLPLTGGTMTGAITAIRETKVAMADNNIDLATGNLFTKTISGVTTFTVSNVLASGNVNSFILELTNGGSSLISWFAGAKWSNGTIPVLTAAGIDVLGFYTYDGGVTWKGKVIDKDVK